VDGSDHASSKHFTKETLYFQQNQPAVQPLLIGTFTENNPQLLWKPTRNPTFALKKKIVKKTGSSHEINLILFHI